jgi:hypothetical protein
MGSEPAKMGHANVNIGKKEDKKVFALNPSAQKMDQKS